MKPVLKLNENEIIPICLKVLTFVAMGFFPVISFSQEYHYVGDIDATIEHFVSGSDNLIIDYDGGILNPVSGDGISALANDSLATGNIYIGYSDPVTPEPIMGTIISSGKGINVYAHTDGGSDTNQNIIFIANAAQITTTDTSIYGMTSGGDITLSNSASGTLTSANGDAIYLSTVSAGSIVVTNAGSISSPNSMGMNLTTANGGIAVRNTNSIASQSNAIYMTSSGNGTLSIFNTGSITTTGTGTYAIFASTSGAIDIINTGHLIGNGSSSYGIYVSSNVTGGLIRNAAIIDFAQAIYVGGSNIEIILAAGSHLNGDLYIYGSGNILSVGYDKQEITGQIFINSGNTYRMSIIDSSIFGAIESDSYISISGAELLINVTYASVHESDVFVILETEGTIGGTFINAQNNDIITLGDNDEYQFQINYEAERVYLTSLTTVIIPEPSSYGLFFCTFLFGLIFLRRHKNTCR